MTSPGVSPLTGHKKSIVWKYFNKEDNFVICTLCTKRSKYCNGTGGMLYHLRNVHRKIVKDEDESPGCKTKLTNYFTKDKKYERGSKEQVDLNEATAKYILKDVLPIDTVDHEAFCEFV